MDDLLHPDLAGASFFDDNDEGLVEVLSDEESVVPVGPPAFAQGGGRSDAPYPVAALHDCYPAFLSGTLGPIGIGRGVDRSKVTFVDAASISWLNQATCSHLIRHCGVTDRDWPRLFWRIQKLSYYGLLNPGSLSMLTHLALSKIRGNMQSVVLFGVEIEDPMAIRTLAFIINNLLNYQLFDGYISVPVDWNLDRSRFMIVGDYVAEVITHNSTLTWSIGRLSDEWRMVKLTTVCSLETVLLHDRSDFQIECLADLTYDSFLEWLLIEGSMFTRDYDLNLWKVVGAFERTVPALERHMPSNRHNKGIRNPIMWH